MLQMVNNLKPNCINKWNIKTQFLSLRVFEPLYFPPSCLIYSVSSRLTVSTACDPPSLSWPVPNLILRVWSWTCRHALITDGCNEPTRTHTQTDTEIIQELNQLINQANTAEVCVPAALCWGVCVCLSACCCHMSAWWCQMCRLVFKAY